MTNPETPQPTRGGLTGNLGDRIRQAAGSLVGSRDRVREGRPQAAVEPETDAARGAQAGADARTRLQQRGADLAERAVAVERAAAAQQAARLEQGTRAAKLNADAIDPRSDR